MPRMDGHTLVAEVRRRSAVPILVLTVRDEEREKVRLLDAGRGRLRDEALRRLGARRPRARPAAPNRSLEGRRRSSRWGDIEVDPDARSVRKAGKPVHLTPLEFSILLALLSKPGAVWTHRQLMAAVWGTTAGVTNDTLRVHMGGLRRKLEDDPNRPRWFQTEPWVGYRFSPE